MKKKKDLQGLDLTKHWHMTITMVIELHVLGHWWHLDLIIVAMRTYALKEWSRLKTLIYWKKLMCEGHACV